MWEAAAWAKDRQHLGPLTALTTCCSTYSRYFTFTSVCYCKSYFCSNTRMCNKAAHHFPSSAAQFLSLLPIQGHTRGGGRYFVSTSPKTWLEKTLAFECETWGWWHVSRDMSRASLHLPPLSRQIPTLISPAMDGFLTTPAARIWPAGFYRESTCVSPRVPLNRRRTMGL